MSNAPMSPLAYRALGTLAAAIGLSACGVGGWFVWLLLEQTEQDHGARNALMLAAALLTTGQIAAFGIAGLLPVSALRALRWVLLALGATLFLAEVAGTTMAQRALIAAADAQAQLLRSRAAELRRVIDAQRATAAGLRESAAAQARSVIAASRADGSESLRQAAAIEAGVLPLVAELARLEAAPRPTLAVLLGADRTEWFLAARSALIALVGVVMMSAAGALWRAARDTSPAAPAARPAVMVPAQPLTRRPDGTYSVPGVIAAAAMTPIAAAVAVPVVAVAPAATREAVAAPQQTQEVAPIVPAYEEEALEAASVAAAEQHEDERYRTAIEAVRSGACRPSTRGLQAHLGCRPATAVALLRQMAQAGVVRELGPGRGYEVNNEGEHS